MSAQFGKLGRSQNCRLKGLALVQLRLRVFYSMGTAAWVLVIDGRASRPNVTYSILRRKKPREDFGHILDVLQIDKFFLAVYVALRAYRAEAKCFTSPGGNNMG